MEKLCADCKQPLFGRSDKKFCNDACRSNYHNILNGLQFQEVHHINKTLKRNLSILNKLNPNSKTTIHTQQLLATGIDLNFYTHIYILPNGKTYKFCYHQGYTQINEQKFQLLKKVF